LGIKTIKHLKSGWIDLLTDKSASLGNRVYSTLPLKECNGIGAHHCGIIGIGGKFNRGGLAMQKWVQLDLDWFYDKKEITNNSIINLNN